MRSGDVAPSEGWPRTASAARFALRPHCGAMPAHRRCRRDGSSAGPSLRRPLRRRVEQAKGPRLARDHGVWRCCGGDGAATPIAAAGTGTPAGDAPAGRWRRCSGARACRRAAVRDERGARAPAAAAAAARKRKRTSEKKTRLGKKLRPNTTRTRTRDKRRFSTPRVLPVGPYTDRQL